MLGTEESAFAPKNLFVKRIAHRGANSLKPIFVSASAAETATDVRRITRRWDFDNYPHDPHFIQTLHERPLLFFRPTRECPPRNLATITAEENLSRCSFNLHEREVWLRLRRYELAIAHPTTATQEATLETVTLAAEQFAKELRIYGELVLTKQIVRALLGDVMTALHVDRKDDPDDSELSTICFTITTHESVDAMLEKDNELQDALIKRVPPNACLHFSFTYQFE